MCYVRRKNACNLTTWDTFRPIFLFQLRLIICYSAWCYRAHLQVLVLMDQVTEKTADCSAKVQITFYIHRLNYLAYLTTPITEYPNYILNSIIIFLLTHLLPSAFSLCTQFCFFFQLFVLAKYTTDLCTDQLMPSVSSAVPASKIRTKLWFIVQNLRLPISQEVRSNSSYMPGIETLFYKIMREGFAPTNNYNMT